MKRCMKALAPHQAGSVAMMFALALPVGVALVAAAVNFTYGTWQRAEAQTALDSAALAAVMLFSDASRTPADIEGMARSFLTSKEPEVPDINIKSTVSVEAAVRTVEIGYDSKVESPISFVIWDGDVPVVAKSRAVLQFNRLPVCVLITSPNQNHTLLGRNGAKIDTENCIVQVDTQNWDAVEMRDTAYLHGKNSENCFVGDIHYGDVQPGKAPNCTFFGDPFKTLTKPAFPPEKPAMTGGAIPEGTYKGGLTITANATLRGLYVIKDGTLRICGAANVDAAGATFILTGKDAGLSVDSTGTLTFSPAPATTSGALDGIVFYLDPAHTGAPAPCAGGKPGPGGGAQSTVSKAQVGVSGYIYLAGQKLVLNQGAKLTVNPGGIVADFLLPDNATVKIVGQIDNATHAGQLAQKDSTTLATATLVK